MPLHVRVPIRQMRRVRGGGVRRPKHNLHRAAFFSGKRVRRKAIQTQLRTDIAVEGAFDQEPGTSEPSLQGIAQGQAVVPERRTDARGA